MKRVNLAVNGHPLQVVADETNTVLIDLLREGLGLTGAKQSCDRKGQCGTCMALVDGKPVLSCLTKVGTLDGVHVTTIEGFGHARAARSDPAGVCPGRRRPVRVPHAGHDHERQGALRRQPRSDEGGDQDCAAAQPLPLHRLREDHRCRSPSGQVLARRGNAGRRGAGPRRSETRGLSSAPDGDGEGMRNRPVRRRHPDARCAGVGRGPVSCCTAERAAGTYLTCTLPGTTLQGGAFRGQGDDAPAGESVAEGTIGKWLKKPGEPELPIY